MNSVAMTNLLALIRKFEGGPGDKGYGTPYGGTRIAKVDVSKLTLAQVLDYQTRSLKAGSVSSAMGGYQFLKKTLITTMQQMNLGPHLVWKPALQDRMAIHLMEGRGLSKYLAGKITAEAFCNHLAMEWASLPVVTAIKGSKGFVLKPGQSYYAGDGLNRAHHPHLDVLSAVKALKATVYVPAPPPASPIPPPPPPPPKPEARTLWGRFWEWLWG